MRNLQYFLHTLSYIIEEKSVYGKSEFFLVLKHYVMQIYVVD